MRRARTARSGLPSRARCRIRLARIHHPLGSRRRPHLDTVRSGRGRRGRRTHHDPVGCRSHGVDYRDGRRASDVHQRGHARASYRHDDGARRSCLAAARQDSESAPILRRAAGGACEWSSSRNSSKPMGMRASCSIPGRAAGFPTGVRDGDGPARLRAQGLEVLEGRIRAARARHGDIFPGIRPDAAVADHNLASGERGCLTFHAGVDPIYFPRQKAPALVPLYWLMFAIPRRIIWASAPRSRPGSRNTGSTRGRSFPFRTYPAVPRLHAGCPPGGSGSPLHSF